MTNSTSVNNNNTVKITLKTVQQKETKTNVQWPLALVAYMCLNRWPTRAISLDYAMTLIWPFLEHRITLLTVVYIKFNSHKRTISYSLWKGHDEVKTYLGWKKRLPIYGETQVFQIPHGQRDREYARAKLASCERELFKVFQPQT